MRTYHTPFPMLWVILLVLGALIFSLMLGRYPQAGMTSISALTSDTLAQQLVLNIRMPRVIMAFSIGMSLAAAGCVLQMVFRNPLVDSGFLGVSQGAGFGASLAIVVLNGQPIVVQACAAGFAFLGLASSYLVSRRVRLGDSVLRLVLSGIAVSAMYSAGTSVLKYMADPLHALQDLTFWLMGGLIGVTWPDVVQVLPIIIPCMVILYLMRWRLNLLSMRDETAFSLGVSTGRERAVILVAAVAATAAAVSKSGLVGWIGLIVPHIARRLMGSDAQHTLPASMLLGGMFCLLCDDVSRTVFPGEIPLGILTSFIGAAFFITMLMRRQVKVRV